MRVDKVYKSSEYPGSRGPDLGTFGEVSRGANAAWARTLGELSEDAHKVGGALATFPYSSALKIAGLASIVYIGFKVIRKFVNIEKSVKHFLRSK